MHDRLHDGFLFHLGQWPLRARCLPLLGVVELVVVGDHLLGCIEHAFTRDEPCKALLLACNLGCRIRHMARLQIRIIKQDFATAIELRQREAARIVADFGDVARPRTQAETPECDHSHAGRHRASPSIQLAI
jgi:hypothetical protein